MSSIKAVQKILVTGANGQLGSELRDLLTPMGQVESFFLDRKQLPLEQTILIQDILGMYQPDIIIHAAAYTAVDLAEDERLEAENINFLATDQIAEYCAIHSVKLIYISTDYVFDGLSKIALTEEADTHPINFYGKTKLMGEEVVQRLCPNAIIIRTSWLYSIYGKNFVKTMLNLMKTRDTISVVHDQIGSPTNAADLAAAIIDIIFYVKWYPGIYHYANEGAISWYQFAMEIKNYAGLTCEVNNIPSVDYITKAARPKFSLLNTSKIKKTYNLVIPNWQESLQGVIQTLLNK